MPMTYARHLPSGAVFATAVFALAFFIGCEPASEDVQTPWKNNEANSSSTSNSSASNSSAANSSASNSSTTTTTNNNSSPTPNTEPGGAAEVVLRRGQRRRGEEDIRLNRRASLFTCGTLIQLDRPQSLLMGSQQLRHERLRLSVREEVRRIVGWWQVRLDQLKQNDTRFEKRSAGIPWLEPFRSPQPMRRRFRHRQRRSQKAHQRHCGQVGALTLPAYSPLPVPPRVPRHA